MYNICYVVVRVLSMNKKVNSSSYDRKCGKSCTATTTCGMQVIADSEKRLKAQGNWRGGFKGKMQKI